MTNRIERKEQKLKRAFESAIARKQEEIEKNQKAIIAAKELIESLIKEGAVLIEEKAVLLTDYNEFIETLEDEKEEKTSA